MSKKTITYFNDIDFEADDFFTSDIFLDAQTVSLDLQFYNGIPDYDWIRPYENYVTKLEEYKVRVDKAIAKNFKDEEIAFEYLEHLLEELDDHTIEKLIDRTNTDRTNLEQLLTILKLKKIIFNFDNDEFAIWNYSLGRDISNYVLAVYTDKNGKVLNFSIDN